MVRRRPRGTLRFVVAVVIALVSLFSYFWSSTENPVTGEAQRVALSTEQEIALGVQSAPQMAQQFGGESRDPAASAEVDRLGQQLLVGLDKILAESGHKNPYPFEFHLLADDQTVNAFALPGGQVFVTAGLLNRLTTEGQAAVVIGHEIGHVLSRHSAQQMAKQRLTQGLVGATAVGTNRADAAQIASVVGGMINLKYGRGDELEADKWGVRLAYAAGYDPRAIYGVMKVLEEAGGGGGTPEFMQSHPKPANRIEYAKEVIAEEFPDGVPSGLTP